MSATTNHPQAIIEYRQQFFGGTQTLLGVVYDTLVKNHVDHVQLGVGGVGSSQVVIGPSKPLSRQPQPPRHHGPQELAQHVNVEIGLDFFQPFPHVTPRGNAFVGSDTFTRTCRSLWQVWQLGDSEIPKNKLPVSCDEDVGGFNVAVNDFFLVE